MAHFTVDGVILGDGRTWDDVRFDRVDEATLPLLATSEGVAEQVVVVVDPLIEDLIGSVVTAGTEPVMEVLRTPDERFAGLPDFASAPHYREVTADDGTALRMHFLDEGPRDADPVLLLHGNPSWCYPYRLMIPGLVARGHRVLAPGLMGLGRSDKPVDQDMFTLAGHVDWLTGSTCCRATANGSTGWWSRTPACPRAGG